MVKSPARWQQPASDKASAVAEEKQLRPGKSDLPTPRDNDWLRQGKESGRGFCGNAIQVNHYSHNPAAGEYRNPPEHKYNLPSGGADGGSARVEQQNRLASKRK